MSPFFAKSANNPCEPMPRPHCTGRESELVALRWADLTAEQLALMPHADKLAIQLAERARREAGDLAEPRKETR